MVWGKEPGSGAGDAGLVGVASRTVAVQVANVFLPFDDPNCVVRLWIRWLIHGRTGDPSGSRSWAKYGAQ